MYNFQDLVKKGITIPKSDFCKKAYTYELEEKVAWALNTALGTGRPLLVFGDPGVGKSQLALAAAAGLTTLSKFQWKNQMHVITARTEAEELLYRYDAVARLAESQLGDSDDQPAKKRMKPENFVSAGVFWQAFNPVQAEQYRLGREPDTTTEPQYTTSPTTIDQPKMPVKGTVLLIDEIDKADHDVCNSLLDLLDQKRFFCPHLTQGQWVNADTDTYPHLVIFTSNNERDLPAAFIRRCAVLTMDMGETDSEIRHWLEVRAEHHFPKKKTEDDPLSYLLWKPLLPPKRDGAAENRNEATSIQADAITQAIEYFVTARTERTRSDIKPSLAEFLDLLNAVLYHAQTANNDRDRLVKIKEALGWAKKFTLQKANQQQRD